MSLGNKQQKIRLGLIGASNIAAKVLPSIRAVSEIEVVAVAAKRPGKAEEFARTHKIARHYDTYEECLAESTVDAVYISTLNSDHSALIKKSLDAGKHVLCEKPLVTTRSDADMAFATAKNGKLILLEGFMYRFHPQIQKLKEIIASGQIGDIRSIRVNFAFILYDFVAGDLPSRASANASGGALMDVGCYGVDFVNSIMRNSNVKPRIQVATRFRDDKRDYDLSTCALLDYQGGPTAVIECAADTPSINTWEVCGTKGSVTALRFDPQGRSDVPIYVVNEESEAQLIYCPSADTFEAEFRNFSRAVLGLEEPHIKAVESIQNAEIIDMIRECAQRC